MLYTPYHIIAHDPLSLHAHQASFSSSAIRELNRLIGIPQNVYKSQPGFWL